MERESPQARNAIEVASVVRTDCIAKFQHARTDNQISERQVDSVGRLLAADPGDDLGGGLCHRMDGDRGFQFVEKLSAWLAAFRRIGTMDSVRQFGNGQRADDDRHIADPRANVLDHVRGGALAVMRTVMLFSIVSAPLFVRRD